MKILYIANRSEIFSGGQISLLELLSHLDRSRFEPIVLCPDEGELADRVRSMGVAVLLWEMPTARTINLLRTRDVVRKLKSIIQEKGAGIVHTNGSRAQFYASLAVKGTEARLVWHVRESVRDLPLYDRYLVRSADRVICVSEGAKKIRFGYMRRLIPKIKVIYNGVDSRKFAKDTEKGKSLRRELGIGEEEVLVGNIGILIPRKGHRFLFKGFKKILEKHPEIKLLVMGRSIDEGYTSHVKDMIWKMEIEKNVLFEAPREDMKAVLSALNIFVLPSWGEGFSRVLLEAMACSCPIITTDVGGNNEAIQHDESGLLIPYGDVDRLAGQLERFLSDPGSARRMGENARKRAKELFSIENHVSQVQELYRELKGQG
ncbi:MAG: glycosyltransferase family 4 protein [Candidatus Omnitrophota bacterium]